MTITHDQADAPDRMAALRRPAVTGYEPKGVVHHRSAPLSIVAPQHAGHRDRRLGTQPRLLARRDVGVVSFADFESGVGHPNPPMVDPDSALA